MTANNICDCEIEKVILACQSFCLLIFFHLLTDVVFALHWFESCYIDTKFISILIFFFFSFSTVYSLNRPWRDCLNLKDLNFFSFYFCELKNRWMKKSGKVLDCEYQFLLSFYFRNYRELVIVMALASFSFSLAASLQKISKAVELVLQISFQKKLGLLLFWFLAMH